MSPGDVLPPVPPPWPELTDADRPVTAREMYVLLQMVMELALRVSKPAAAPIVTTSNVATPK